MRLVRRGNLRNFKLKSIDSGEMHDCGWEFSDVEIFLLKTFVYAQRNVLMNGAVWVEFCISFLVRRHLHIERRGSLTPIIQIQIQIQMTWGENMEITEAGVQSLSGNLYAEKYQRVMRWILAYSYLVPFRGFLLTKGTSVIRHHVVP